jgi:hypothetical protein
MTLCSGKRLIVTADQPSSRFGSEVADSIGVIIDCKRIDSCDRCHVMK